MDGTTRAAVAGGTISAAPRRDAHHDEVDINGIILGELVENTGRDEVSDGAAEATPGTVATRAGGSHDLDRVIAMGINERRLGLGVIKSAVRTVERQRNIGEAATAATKSTRGKAR